MVNLWLVWLFVVGCVGWVMVSFCLLLCVFVLFGLVSVCIVFFVSWCFRCGWCYVVYISGSGALLLWG